MKQCFKVLLSLILVLSLVLGILPMTALAEGGTGSGIMSGAGGSSIEITTGSSCKQGSMAGYRVYLTKHDILTNHMGTNNTVTFPTKVSAKPLNRSTPVLNKFKDFAIYEIFDASGGNDFVEAILGGTDTLYSWDYDSKGDYISSCIVLKSGVGSTSSFKELVGTAGKTGKPFPTLGTWRYDEESDFGELSDWANAVFSDTDGVDITNFLEKYKNLIDTSWGDGTYSKASLPLNASAFRTGGWCVVVEPVALIRINYRYTVAWSAQDYFGSGTATDHRKDWADVDDSKVKWVENLKGFPVYEDSFADWAYSLCPTDDNGDTVFGSINGFRNLAHMMLKNFFIQYTSKKYNQGKPLNGLVTTQNTTEGGFGIFYSPDVIESGIKSNFSETVLIKAPEIKGTGTKTDNISSKTTISKHDSSLKETSTKVSNVFYNWTDGYDKSKYSSKGDTVLNKLTDLSGVTADTVSDYNLSEYRVYTQNLDNCKKPTGDFVNTISSVNLNSVKGVLNKGILNFGSTYGYQLQGDVVSDVILKKSYTDKSLSGSEASSVISKASMMAHSKSVVKVMDAETINTTEDDVKDKKGMVVALAVPDTKVDTSIVEVTLNTDSKGTSVSVGSEIKTSYSVQFGGRYTIKPSKSATTYLIVYPKTMSLSTAVGSDTYGTWRSVDLNASPEANIKALAKKLGVDGDGSCAIVLGDRLAGTTEGDTVIGLGSYCKTDSSLCGYNVVVVRDNRVGNMVDNMVSEKIEGAMQIKEYELNYIYPTLLGEKEGTLVSVRLNNEVANNNLKLHNSLYGLSNLYATSSVPAVNNSIWISREADSNGSLVDSEIEANSKISDKFERWQAFLINKDENVGCGYGFIGFVYDRAKVEDGRATFNYAVNLKRSLYASDTNKTVLSALNPMNNGYLTDKLTDVYSRVGVWSDYMPATTTFKGTQSLIGSTKLIGNTDEFLRWTVDRFMTRFVSAKDEGGNTIYVPYTVAPLTNGSKETSSSFSTSCYDYLAGDKGTPHTDDKVVHMDTADTSGVGLNTSATSDYFSSLGVVTSWDKSLNYFPEVEMRGYIPTSKNFIFGTDTVAPINLYALGKRVRSLTPAGLNFITVSSSKSDNIVTGKTSSSGFSTAGNAYRLSKDMENLPVVAEGADISMMTSLSDINFNLSSYQLDLIDPSIDTSEVLSKSGMSYYDVVASGSQYGTVDKSATMEGALLSSKSSEVLSDGSKYNVKAIWNAFKSGTLTKKEAISSIEAYKSSGISTGASRNAYEWAKEVGDKIGVEAMLVSHSSNGSVVSVANNFNLGNINLSGKVSSQSDVKALESYPLMIKEGALVTDPSKYQEGTSEKKSAESYKALLQSIAKAMFNVTEPTKAQLSKAKTTFNRSGLYNLIINSCESSNDDNNRSLSCDAVGGGRTHWYDEQVRTFVVRKYDCGTLNIGSVATSDKIDYGFAFKGELSKTEAFTKGYKTRWYLSVVLGGASSASSTEGVSWKDLNGDTISSYNPKADNPLISLSQALNQGNVLVNNIHVDGADFIIGNSTTSDRANN